MGERIIRNIKDCNFNNQRVINRLDDLNAYVVFFNPCVFANWDHPCEYLIIINENFIINMKYNRGISEKVELEEIDYYDDLEICKNYQCYNCPAKDECDTCGRDCSEESNTNFCNKKEQWCNIKTDIKTEDKNKEKEE